VGGGIPIRRSSVEIISSWSSNDVKYCQLDIYHIALVGLRNIVIIKYRPMSVWPVSEPCASLAAFRMCLFDCKLCYIIFGIKYDDDDDDVCLCVCPLA